MKPFELKQPQVPGGTCWLSRSPVLVTASTVRLTATCVVSLAFLTGWAAMGQTTVVQVSPRGSATRVNLQATVEIHFSNGLTLTKITPDSIRLLNPAGLPVRAQLGFDIEADVVNIHPNERLTPQTLYTLEVNRKLVDKEGVPIVPFRSSFTTGADLPAPIQGEGFQFTKTKVDDESGPTAIAVGPDGNVYVATSYGNFYRLQINPETGLSISKEKLFALSGNRKILGLAFDPEATASNLVAWITHDDRKAENLDVGTFSGVVSKLLIPTVSRGRGATETQCIIVFPDPRVIFWNLKKVHPDASFCLPFL